MIRALVESLTVTDVQSRLAEVDVPVMVVHRRSDFVPFAEAELLVRGIRGARLVELEGSDHLPWAGDASSVLSPMAEFVAVVAGRPRQRATAVSAARPRRPATGWEALTDAERRVAQLVARGLANGEVAERLYVSRYTVETHLKHVFAKLGVSSRAELAALELLQNRATR
jgi:DNA-binding CsgD family transcriptional regulator